MTSADILFFQGLLFDLDRGPHIAMEERYSGPGERAPEEAKTPENTNRETAEKRIQAVVVGNLSSRYGGIMDIVA
ncbi:MAG: hypothetical protein Ct9H90mP1_2450 [Methanobacteriota archaeon]|nr:MAG: hypothetical protein Ct9H90mP1_2450 [Euryarchaeota archaeon]